MKPKTAIRIIIYVMIPAIAFVMYRLYIPMTCMNGTDLLEMNKCLDAYHPHIAEVCGGFALIAAALATIAFVKEDER